MKNLMIHIAPDPPNSYHFKGGAYSKEILPLIKVQIENSLRLGWKAEDIILITNFPFEYMGVRSVLSKTRVRKNGYMSKIDVIADIDDMFPNEFFFFHDLDAYQVCSTQELMAGISMDKLNIPDYGCGKKLYNSGVMFFSSQTAGRIFSVLAYICGCNEDNDDESDFKSDEDVIAALLLHYQGKHFSILDAAFSVNRLDISYNLGIHDTEYKFIVAQKPIKILHFHPISRGRWIYDMFGFGLKWKLNGISLAKDLTPIFEKHFPELRR